MFIANIARVSNCRCLVFTPQEAQAVSAAHNSQQVWRWTFKSKVRSLFCCCFGLFNSGYKFYLRLQWWVQMVRIRNVWKSEQLSVKIAEKNGGFVQSRREGRWSAAAAAQKKTAELQCCCADLVLLMLKLAQLSLGYFLPRNFSGPEVCTNSFYCLRWWDVEIEMKTTIFAAILKVLFTKKTTDSTSVCQGGLDPHLLTRSNHSK